MKGLLERIAHSHQYRLTTLASKVITFFTRLYERIFLSRIYLFKKFTVPSGYDILAAMSPEKIQVLLAENATLSAEVTVLQLQVAELTKPKR